MPLTNKQLLRLCDDKTYVGTMATELHACRDLLNTCLAAFEHYRDLPTDKYPGPPADLMMRIKAALYKT